MEKKSNKGLVISLVIFILATIGLGVYLAYDKGLLDFIKPKVKENKNEETKKEIKDEELDINSRLVQNLYNEVSKETENPTWLNFWMYNNTGSNDFNMEEDFNSETSEEIVKMQIVFSNLTEKDSLNINCDEYEIPDFQDKEYYSLCYAEKNMNFFEPRAAYKKETVENVYKKLFGSNSKLDTSVVMYANGFTLPTYYYIAKYDLYVAYRAELGGTYGSGGYSTKLEKASKKGDEIKIFESVKKYEESNSSNPTETELTDTFTFVYTFKLDKDGMYNFISRVKEK